MRKQIQAVDEKGNPDVYIAKVDRNNLVQYLVDMHKGFDNTDDSFEEFLALLDKLNDEKKIQAEAYKKIGELYDDLSMLRDDSTETINKMKSYLEDL